MNAFNTRGPSVFVADGHFNGHHLRLSQRATALGIGLGVVPSQSNINTTKTTPADKRSRLRKGTI